MTQPYIPGQTLAWLDPDAAGIRLHRATVIHVEATSDESHWRIHTDRGDAIVDQAGHSGQVLPIDEEIATELYVRGDGYLTLPTRIDRHSVLELNRSEAALDHDTDLGEDFGID